MTSAVANALKGVSGSAFASPTLRFCVQCLGQVKPGHPWKTLTQISSHFEHHKILQLCS